MVERCTISALSFKITEKNLQTDGAFAATKLEDIAAHEYGHIFAKGAGINGLDIASEAHYNINKERLAESDILDHMQKELSKYAGTDKKEIIPEIFAKNESDPDDFSRECVRLLKEMVAQ